MTCYKRLNMYGHDLRATTEVFKEEIVIGR